MENKITLNTITSNLPKLRSVAAFAFCCENSKFSLSQYSPWKILFVWKMPGFKTCIPEERQTNEHLSELRKACVYIESYLIDARFENNGYSEFTVDT